MKRIFLWGTGTVANQILNTCDVWAQYEILGIIDNDISKSGTVFFGEKVYSPEILNDIKPDGIVVMTDCFEEIKNQIIEIRPELSEFIENKNFFFKRTLVNRYKDTKDKEIQSILEYLKNNCLDIFNYDFKRKYDSIEIAPIFDTDCQMYYVLHDGKKLYFAKYMDTENKVKEYYRGLLIEQDEHSPHRYLAEDFSVRDGGIVVDVGVAEGNFSLGLVDKVSKIYMIEADERWIEALAQTFKAYKNKVVIVQKYVTSINEGKYATLDEIIEEPVDFVKMDIEGNEWDALIGAEKTIKRSPDVKCAICAYHRDYDEILIKDVLLSYRMRYETTSGYMWFPFGREVSTRLCRGIVRGKK